MSTLNDLTAIVRDITDLDEVDLPLSLIRQYMKDGFQRIVNLERRWPSYETTYTMSTTSNQRAYPISSIGGGDLREVVSMIDNSQSGNRLTLTSTDEAERVWNGSLDTPARPLYYTEWGDIINLYPKPDAVYPITVRGYRKPSYLWVNDGAVEIDCDERFHLAMAYYAISQSYKRLEDNEMSAMYKQSFDEAVSLARREIMKPNSHRPMVMSKGLVRFSEKFWLESLGRTL
jgi:hypothetical protein